MCQAVAGRKLRVAVLGDSWVSSWKGDWTLTSALPEGLKAGFHIHMSADIELITAGFPGFTADRIFSLANLCRLRCLSQLEGGNSLPWYGDLKSPLRRLGFSLLCEDDQESDEDVDVVVIVAGYNDFSHDQAKAKKVFRTLTTLQDLYTNRGVLAVLVTPGQGRAEYEEQRQLLNSLLFGRQYVVDCDALVNKLDDDAWENMEHLTEEGSRQVGILLADAVCVHLNTWTSDRILMGKRKHDWRAKSCCQSWCGRNKRRCDSLRQRSYPSRKRQRAIACT